jgi:hypothetical protein
VVCFALGRREGSTRCPLFHANSHDLISLDACHPFRDLLKLFIKLALIALLNEQISAPSSQMAAARYWRWLPDWSWQRVLFVGGTMVALLIMLSMSQDKPTPDLSFRVMLLAVGTLAVSALAFAKESALGKAPT